MSKRAGNVQPETIERIRALAKAGRRRREAAEQLGMSFSTLAKVARRNGIEFHGTPAHNPNSERWAHRRAKPKPTPIISLADTTDEIARYIAERGVTRCPPAFAAPSPQGARP